MATQKQQDLKNALSTVAENRPSQVDPAKTIDGMLKRLAPQIARALPKHMTADRLARIALTTIRQNPKLLECTQESLMGAVMLSAQLGLEPGPLGHAYLVPFWDSKTNSTNAQFQIGYKGMIDLTRRTGEIQTITANEVYENDTFEVEYGSNGHLTHKPFMHGERGDVTKYYAYAKTKDGGEYFYYMTKEDVIKYRDKYTKSKNFKTGEIYGPWATEFDAMAKKTCLKQMIKYMPLSVEVQRQLAQDETVKLDMDEDMTMVPNADIEYEYNPATNEAIDTQKETNSTPGAE
ncbi:recombination protein RecT [Effusibacillus dendaii]|uniref:Recombinase RecT n=1 Tax=Effusibacillus dendaii TaxID=2743772 RepID=A0A7I8DD86_9BACL|nr:recombination protein RecT [Effusibacillus dendaii]BCJ86490.1 hypothetical protein skT53_14750 [Effusibacillus dendaii]